MAGLRFLMPLFALAAACNSLGCALGPIYARRVEGEVVDKQTGKPVADALVFAVYDVEWRSERYEVDTRWARTDAHGRFAMPGHFSMTFGPPFSYTDREYAVFVMHRDYGTFVEVADQRVESWPHHRFRLEIEPNVTRSLFEKPAEWPSLCRGISREGCDAICLYAYGTVDPGDRGSIRRRQPQ